MNCYPMLGDLCHYTKNHDELTALYILQETCLDPSVQILDNAGMDFDKVYDWVVPNKEKNVKMRDYDVKNEVYGDMFEMGVIDPLKVTKNAFVNAVSVATTILTTNAIVTHLRERE